MAVEIVIHSGARQGESIRLDANEFRVGDRSDCEVFFDPALDPPARNRCAVFRLESDGWKLHNTGAGEILVNETVVVTSARVRSGDFIRMSPYGPDFSVDFAARSAAAAPHSSTAARPADLSPAPTAVLGLGGSTGSPAIAKEEVTAAATPGSLREKPAAWMGLIGAAAAVALLLGWLLWGDLRSASEPGTASAPADSQGRPASLSAETTAAIPGRTDSDNRMPPSADRVPARDAALDLPEPETSAASPDPWVAAARRVDPALVLFQVEDPKSDSVWPFATGCAIDENRILTSATVGTELAKFRATGWNVWAKSLSDGVKHSVRDIRVHVGFTESGSEPEKMVYFDIALVDVEQSLPAAAELAPAATLRQLDRGYPVVWAGIPHDGEPTNRFQTYSAESARGKVFVITSLPPSPGGPRVLHVKGAIPANVYGSPLIDADGRIVAVYSESAAAGNDANAQALNLHYAVVVEPQLIDLVRKGQGETVWVPPATAGSPSKSP